ncbi:MAG: FAD binding domain-containing protein [Nitrospinota bacterium]
MKPFEVIAPKTVEEAVEALGHYGDSARALGGGTALALLMRQGLFRPKAIVNLNPIENLRGIRSAPDGGFLIGPLTLHREIESHPLLAERYPALAEMAHHVANPQVRNMGTLGGNLCHADPASDPPAALIAAGAQVAVQGPQGRRSLPVEDLFVGYYETSLRMDEVLCEIRLPAPPQRSGLAYHRYTTTTLEDRPFVCVGVGLKVSADGKKCEDARVAVGGASPAPTRATAAEEALRGADLSEELFGAASERAVEGIEPIDDVRGPASYRLEMVKVFFRRAARDAWRSAREKL